MNVTIKIVTSLMLCLAVLPLKGGCTPTTETAAALSPAKKACAEMLKQSPAGSESFQFWDVTALNSDKDLADMYKVWRDRRGEWLKVFGIAEGAADCVGEAGVLTMASGALVLPDIREQLAVNYQRNTAYTDEVWSAKNPSDPQTTGGSILLRDRFFAWGNQADIDDYLSVVSGQKPSLYDADTAALLEKMPEGFTVRVWHPGYPESLLVYADGVSKLNNHEVLWTSVYKFKSNAAQDSQAQQYLEDIEKDFKGGEKLLQESGRPVPFHDFKITWDGDYVSWSVVVEEQYMISLLFYG